MNTENFTKHSEEVNVLFRCIIIPFSTKVAAHESASVMLKGKESILFVLNWVFCQVEINASKFPQVCFTFKFMLCSV